MTIKLTPDQKAGLITIRSFLLNPNQKEAILSGNSGSGKSTLVKYIAESLEDFLKPTAVLLGKPLILRLQLTATTNEAATILSKSSQNEDVLTVHKLFKLFFRNNYQTGNKDLVTDKVPFLENVLIVVDEASMCNKELRKVIVNNTCKNSKILYVGDPEQLDSVNSVCDIFSSDLPEAHLVTNVRQGGNEIASLGLRFRDAVLDDKMPILDGISTEHIKYVTGEEFKSLISDRYTNNKLSSTHKVLAYTNERVMEYNNYIREMQNGCSGYVEGEYLTTNKAITTNNVVIAKNNTLVKISNIKYMEMHGMNGHQMLVNSDNKTLLGFIPDVPSQAKKAINKLAKKGSWPEMFALQDSILDLRPRFASTVHKAQGGTLDEVFIDLNDICETHGTIQSKARALYVAITRAKQTVYLYGSLI